MREVVYFFAQAIDLLLIDLRPRSLAEDAEGGAQKACPLESAPMPGCLEYYKMYQLSCPGPKV